ncbi:DUF7500 family protein [Halococcoides cellulosivorans]|uniref:DIX domain-containing protein n=1 Tax=Halococcoides cellulosivorans TaxID=1679096 RepID=A0A2R4X149_9EURY|nr:hypothetical protein [Halococcoides cellulosivorans]AWB27518.1 hypothetical protein HARCEL1_07255 [Halococcoides cellulosivorans]
MPGGPDDEDDEGGVLAPEELDITDDEHVAEIEEGRYVVSPHDPIGDLDVSKPSTTAQRAPEPREESAPDPVIDRGAVEEFLEQHMGETSARYGFHVTGTFDERVERREMTSDDVTAVFENLVLWYARHLDRDTPIDEILGILLLEMTVPITYPTEGLRTTLSRMDLGPDDSIADLLEAAERAGGLRF